MISVVLEQHHHVDILVNNAAYTVGKALWAHVPQITREQWEKGFAVNVTAPLVLIEGFWESMKARGGGVIVNVTSGAAHLQPLNSSVRLPGSELPDQGPLYGASKAALDRMANVIAGEGAPNNIAVINLEPGFVLTETMEQTFNETGVDGAEVGAIPGDGSGTRDRVPVCLRPPDALQRPDRERAHARRGARALTSRSEQIVWR